MQTDMTRCDRPGHRWAAPVVWLLLVGAMTAAFGHNFVEMWHRWYPAWDRPGSTLYECVTQGQSYYTHGPLVPLVSLAMIALLIRQTSIPLRPRRAAGLAVLSVSLFLHLAACLARVNFASGFAFIGVLVGLVLFIWGAKALRRLWFALAFLFFMVPLPEVSIAQLNFRLKIIAAEAGVQLAGLAGIAVELVGNRVFLAGDKAMIIANICNGLRTLISVMAFGALYAYVCRLRGIWRIVLFLMSVPVAVVSNAVRVFSLIVVAEVWDVETATGAYHDFSGLMILVMAFLLLFGFEKLVLIALKWFGIEVEASALFGPHRTEQDSGQGAALAGALGKLHGWIALVMVAVTALGCWQLNRSIPPIYDRNRIEQALPAQLSAGQRLWYGYVIPMDKDVLTVLETEDAIMRRYVCEGSSAVDFCVIFSEDNRKGTHPPDLCLEGAGQNIVSKNNVDVTTLQGNKTLPCRELVVQSEDEITYFLYTYKCGGRYTRSFWLQQLVIFVNGLLDRNASGALIRVSTSVDGELPEAKELAKSFLRAGLPHVQRVLP